MKTPGEWGLLWANHENNGMTWTDIVEGIRAESFEETVIPPVEEQQ